MITICDLIEFFNYKVLIINDIFSNFLYCLHFAQTMDPPSPMRRDLEQEEFLEDMINDNLIRPNLLRRI